MEVLDIVQSAAFKSGLVSSFNPDELPGDIQNAGADILANEILPSLNCDRTLDITVTARVYAPTNGRIVLTPLHFRNNFKVLGYADMTSAELANTAILNSGFAEFIHTNHPDWVNEVTLPGGYIKYVRSDANWPQDDFGNFIEFAVWGTDMKVVSGTAPTTPAIMANVNIDFPPMRVEAVLDDSSRVKYEYLYREEFERVLKAAAPCIYTVEEYEDKLVILMKGTDDAKRIILPVPLQLINRTDTYMGQIIASPKFKRYLIDATAFSLATVYGLSTVDSMLKQAEISYNLLKKNKTQPMHKANPSEEINNVLRRNIGGRTFYAGF